MRELVFNFPTLLSGEEKHLKEMFEKLKAVRRAIVAANRANVSVSSGEAAKIESKNAKKSIRQAEEATEEVKRKVMSGAINLKKANERSTFKRSKVLEKRRENDGKLKLDTFDHGNSSGNEMLSPTSTSFHSPSYAQDGQDSSSRVNRGPTLYVRGYDLQSESLHKAFEKFGRIIRIFVEDRKKSAFITLGTTEQAEEAMKEMDGNMVNGITLRVSFARRQNQNGPSRNMNSFLRRRPGPCGDRANERASEHRSPCISQTADFDNEAAEQFSPQSKKTSSVQMAWNQATERASNARHRNNSRTLIDYTDDSNYTTGDMDPSD